jgi:prefoldin subunit 5
MSVQPYIAEDVNVLSKGNHRDFGTVAQHSKTARIFGEAEANMATSNIRSVYNKRLQDTKALKDRAVLVGKSVEAELAASEKAKAELVKLLGDFQLPIQYNAQWLQMRQQNTFSGSSHVVQSPRRDLDHSIVKAVFKSTDDVKAGLAEVAAALKELQSKISALQAAQEVLKRDVSLKIGMMVIDQACMNELVQPVASDEGKMNRVLMQPMRFHTDNEWVNVTSSAMHAAVSAVDHCSAARKHAMKVVRENRESSNLSRHPAVVDALNVDVKYGEKLEKNLDMNAKMIQGEMHKLDKQRKLLQESLALVQDRLRHAQQRMELCGVRSKVDTINVDVEEVLEMEIISMKKSRDEIAHNLRVVEKSREVAMRLLDKTVCEAVEHGKVTVLDKQCLSLRLPQIQSGRVGTPRSVPQSPRQTTSVPR